MLHTRLVGFLLALLIFSDCAVGSSATIPDFVSIPSFIENNGQLSDMNGNAVDQVLFVAQYNQLNVFITTTGITFVFFEKINNPGNLHKSEISWQRVDLELSGATIAKHQIHQEISGASANRYYNQNSNDVILAHAVKRIVIQEIYPGIDWEIYESKEEGFKYNFIVHPFADPAQIQLTYHSALQVDLNDAGEISLNGLSGTLKELAPVCYQGSEANKISSSYILTGAGLYETKYQYQIAAYDQKQILVIDPELYWATYYGGSNEECFNSVTTDNTGNLILVGWTDSPNFPVMDAGTFYQGTKGANEDAMIVKFSPTEERLWATFYGGNHEDWAYSVTVDESGNIFVSGETVSGNFPVFDAGTFYQGALNGDEDVFILKFDNDGNRLWATFYGGDHKEGGHSIAHDASGNIFVTGYTDSDDFPKLNAGTFYQATIGGNVDAFILKFSNTGTRLWATYYGGTLDEAGNSITSDDAGNIFITGDTRSTNFPTYDAGTYYQPAMAGDTDLFVLKFANTGTRLWATYYGGTGSDYGHSIVTDIYDQIYIGGWTESTNLPVQDMGNYFQGTNAGSYDGLLLKFDNSGNRLMSTYFGGTGKEFLDKWDVLAPDFCGNIYFAISSYSAGMPIFDAGCSSYYDAVYGGLGDIFITRFTNENLITWATYYGFDNEDLNACIGVSQLDGNSLYLTGQYNEYDPGAAVPLVDPGGSAWYDGTHNNDDEAFIAKFIPVPLTITTSNSTICDCTDTATATPSCGVAPYNYVWTDGQTTQTAIDLCEGTYEVIVTDADCNIDTATVTIICALPIELTSFSAEYKFEYVELKWSTASELNADYFTMSRSRDNNEFAEVEIVSAQGTTTSGHNYTIYDINPGSGEIYYKLSETDLDGTTTVAGITSVFVAGIENNLTISKINDHTIEVNFNSSANTNYHLQIFDLTGMILLEQEWIVQKGMNTKEIDLTQFHRGVYLISLTNYNERFITKFSL